MIYLDYNATTPIDPEVLRAMMPYLLHHYGNPSSNHPLGVKTSQAVSKARRQVAEFLQASESEIVFTSGASESNNWAIKGVAWQHKGKGRHIVTSVIEHPSVLLGRSSPFVN